MRHIDLVRHCKAEGQAPDAPLTELGRAQAEKLADFYAATPVDLLISSPYERAVRTIEPLASRMGIKLQLDDRLAERLLSAAELPDWRERLRQTYDDLDLVLEGGESSRGAMARAAAVVRDALERKCRHAVLVTHGNLMSLLLKHFDDRFGFREWEVLSNPDVYRLTFADEVPEIRRIWSMDQ